MARSRKVFAVHPREILKTEFLEPMGVSAYELAKALNFPGIYEVVRGTGPSAPTLPFAWENISPTRGLQEQRFQAQESKANPTPCSSLRPATR